MIRYVCKNPYCLFTYLSDTFDKNKKCDLCGQLFMSFGKPNLTQSKPNIVLSRHDLLKEYVMLQQKAISIGLTEDECIKSGRAVRLLSYEERKNALEKAGLWDESIIYKYVFVDGLMKMVVDRNAMNYRKRKNDGDN